MPDPTTDQPGLDQPGLDQPAGDRDAAESRPSDDTVELDAGPSLADDLLHSDDPAEGEGVGRSELEHGESGEHGDSGADARTPGGLSDRAADSTAPDEDDEYFEPHDQKRSRVTTGLLVALIFALGVLAGVLVGRLLTPTPAPQIVYVLNDAPSSGASSLVPPSPTPSVSR